jgi:peroxiredoxin
MFIIPGRSTFLIDREGTVREVFTSQTDYHGHAKRALEFVRN